MTDPTIKEPTDDPDDDIEAEVPDAREDEVPESVRVTRQEWEADREAALDRLIGALDPEGVLL